jgi:hypothetical protein
MFITTILATLLLAGVLCLFHAEEAHGRRKHPRRPAADIERDLLAAREDYALTEYTSAVETLRFAREES